MKKLMLLAAAGAGYVLGAKAGRERYEQIVAGARRVRQDPRVQEKVHQATEAVREQAPVVADTVKEKAMAAASRGGHASQGASGTATTA